MIDSVMVEIQNCKKSVKGCSGNESPSLDPSNPILTEKVTAIIRGNTILKSMSFGIRHIQI